MNYKTVVDVGLRFWLITLVASARRSRSVASMRVAHFWEEALKLLMELLERSWSDSRLFLDFDLVSTLGYFGSQEFEPTDPAMESY